ncbi:hypothetical protein A6R68_12306 [Neotoma lepida]|uniref:Uncharacterized protein n=1 Tax=Neotoma lepida TaxID=56216 RepID=A0A1A6H459_NEOLE|nr:hypothetical protein A6R68_12306 [Neotoma lepida]
MVVYQLQNKASPVVLLNKTESIFPAEHHNVDMSTILQERSTCGSCSSLRPEEMASTSQNCDPVVGDNLLSSEGLNEFPEVVESEIAVLQTGLKNRKDGVDDDICKLHIDHSKLSESLERY